MKLVPFETSTTMDAGSMAKTFTALSILMLEEENRLSLNDPVVDHITSFPYDEIKIKHLIGQTSGLVPEDFVFHQAEEGKVLTNDFFLQKLADSVPSLSFEPGSRVQYNGINHILLALIIENLSGASFDEFIRYHIAEPLEMNEWFLRPARLSDWSKDRTKGYKKIGDSLTISDSEDFEGFYGDCNLFFSAEDLLKWSQSFYSHTLIDKDQLNELLQSKDSISHFNALHWYALEDTNQFHFTGHWKGFYTMVYFDVNRKRSIIYLSNTSMDYWLRPQLVTTLVNILDDSDEPLTKPNPVEPSIEYLNAKYHVERLGIIVLSKIGDHLKISIGSNSYHLYEVEEKYFYVPATDLWIWFTNTSEQGLMINCTNIYGSQIGRPL